MQVGANVRGLAELAQALKDLPASIASKNGGPLARSVKAAADLVADEARRIVPVKTGKLRDNIVVRRSAKPQGTEGYTVTARAGRGPKDPNGAYYAGIVEFGSSTHQAQPFMRPAIESQADAAVKVIADELAEGIRRGAQRAKKIAR